MLYECVPNGHSKATAIQRVLDHYQIPLRDAYVFGDSMNDLEMIRAAGVGICMGNGSETLKKAADEVCAPVGEDGLYRAFQAHRLM